MRYAIFSDIHNHTDALSDVLQDAATRQVDAYLCLGDIGIDACVTLVRNVQADVVFGNWEVAGWRHLSPSNQRWVLSLPPMRKYDGFWISHAAPVWPKEVTSLRDLDRRRHQTSLHSVFPYYLAVDDGLWQAFGELLTAKVQVLFHGHTHRQIIWTFTADNLIKQAAPIDMTLLSDETYIVGVGSVGQPRDFPKPGYVIFDSNAMAVQFIRVTDGVSSMK